MDNETFARIGNAYIEKMDASGHWIDVVTQTIADAQDRGDNETLRSIRDLCPEHPPNEAWRAAAARKAAAEAAVKAISKEEAVAFAQCVREQIDEQAKLVDEKARREK